jgi:hypothetical protein
LAVEQNLVKRQQIWSARQQINSALGQILVAREQK